MSIRILVAPDTLVAGLHQLSGVEHHYLCHVRRAALGAQVVLLDGDGRMALAELRSIEKEGSELWVQEPVELPPPDFRLHIAPALIKGERMEWAITKMVELGVHQITPLQTERSIVRLKKDRALARHKRFESLAQAACRQSLNTHPTQIAPPQSLPDWLAGGPEAQLKLIPYLGGPAEPLESLLDEAAVSSALVMIGPEGGFSSNEADLALSSGFRPVSLGPRILRAETACIYIASVLGFRYGDVGRR